MEMSSKTEICHILEFNSGVSVISMILISPECMGYNYFISQYAGVCGSAQRFTDN